jgi:DNA-binding HxlR family transcriptional regulator
MDPPLIDQPSPATLPAACALRLLLDQLGDKWSICLLLSLADGPVRFNALKRTVEGVTQKMLGQTLRRLELNGLVERRAYATRPMRVEYEATGLGRTLTPIIKDLQIWADENAAQLASAREQFRRNI